MDYESTALPLSYEPSRAYNKHFEDNHLPRKLSTFFLRKSQQVGQEHLLGINYQFGSHFIHIPRQAQKISAHELKNDPAL